jgi:hypothetical protein
MSLTAASLTTALAALSVTGVTSKLTYFPLSLNNASLPVMWPGVPRIEAFESVMDHNGLDVTVSCDLTIAVKPLLQGEKSGGYAANMTIMDALESAIVTWYEGPAAETLKAEWSIQAGVVTIGETSPGVPAMYHSVTASIKVTELQ